MESVPCLKPTPFGHGPKKTGPPCLKTTLFGHDPKENRTPPCLKQTPFGHDSIEPICVHFWHEVSLLHPLELSQSEYPHCHPERSEGSSRDRVHFWHEVSLLHPSESRQSKHPHCHPERSEGSSRDRTHFCHETAQGLQFLKGDRVHFRGETASGPRWSGIYRSLSSDLQRSLHSAGHRSWRWPASSSKQAARATPKGSAHCKGPQDHLPVIRYACFVPVVQKMQNNQNFTLSPFGSEE